MKTGCAAKAGQLINPEKIKAFKNFIIFSFYIIFCVFSPEK